MGDPYRFSALAHATRDICAPLSSATIGRVIENIGAPAGGRVLDVGCGKGEVLLRLVERYGLFGTGIEISPYMASEARVRAEQRGLRPPQVIVCEEDARAFPFASALLDIAVCIGSTHALGGLEQTLEALVPAVRPGGLVLVGDVFWRQWPEVSQLAALGMDESGLRDLSQTLAIGEGIGLRMREIHVSSEDEWNSYEAEYIGAVEQWSRAHPSDPEAETYLARARFMHRTYVEWRAACMGFVLCLYQVS